jgi:hypothetical protein
MATKALPPRIDPVTIDRMAKKPTGGQHKTPRKPIQVPEEWLQVARKLASKRAQPTLWLIIQLLADLADKEGIERPKFFPWQDQ